MKKYRVWCKNRNEWESHPCFLSPDGVPLYDCLDEEANFERCSLEVIGNVYENLELLRETK